MPNLVWSHAEREFLAANAGRMKDSDVAAALCRITGRLVTLHSVRKMRMRLGIKKRRGRGLCELVSRQLPPGNLGLSISS